jgi:hypothetical protein
VGNGVIVLQEGADDCVISGLTVYNNYGTTVEPGNTAHQMSIFGRATRTIVINSNVWADGNDALSLWAKEGKGMYSTHVLGDSVSITMAVCVKEVTLVG